MRQVALIAIATTLALFTGGCDGLGGGGDTPTAETSPTESPVVVSPADGSSPDAAQPSPGASPDAATSTEPPPVAALPSNLDLIPSTNAEQRVRAIQGERSDPFSIIPTTPSVQIAPAPPGTAGNGGRQTGGGQAGGGQAGGRQGTTGQRSPGGQTTGQNRGGTNAGRGNQTPGGLAPIPNLVPGGRTTSGRTTPVAPPPPPPPPQPTLARAVEVLGVVQIGGVPYAIVNAPNESSSRYVQEGQLLSNGQVVVRRIDVTGPEPVVVFEQFGVEVVTAVGGGGAPEETTESPAAAVPTDGQGRAG